MGAKFLNIEIEVSADFELNQISEALSGFISVNYCGEAYEGKPGTHFFSGSFAAFFDEHTDDDTEKEYSVDGIASELCDLLDKLEPASKELWMSALERVFDVGLDANLDRRCIIEFLSPQTMRKMSELGIRLAVSVYALELEKEIHGLRKGAQMKKNSES